MKNQAITGLSVALLTLAGGAAVATQTGDEDGHDRKHRLHRGVGMHEAADPARMVRHLTRTLELDQTQQQEIENIVSAAKPEMDALRERAGANRQAMHELDVNDSNHEARLNELALEKGAIVSEQALLHGRLKSEINGVLTPEQQQELASKGEKMREHFRKRRDGRG